MVTNTKKVANDASLANRKSRERMMKVVLAINRGKYVNAAAYDLSDFRKEYFISNE